MFAVGEIDEGIDRAAVGKMDRPDFLFVDSIIVDLANLQIPPDLVVTFRRQAMGEAATTPAGQQPEDEARLPGRAAVMFGIDAEGAMPTLQARRNRLGRGEAGVPHQRAVAENPARTRRTHAWLRWISARRISRVRVKRSNSLSPSPQRMARCR